MNLEIGTLRVQATTASVMAKDVAEHVSALMVFGGIESISYDRLSAGLANSLHVSIAHFHEAPKKVKDIGVIIKDDLARILAAANINRIIAKPSEQERIEIRTAWANAVRNMETENGGSGQDSDADEN